MNRAAITFVVGFFVLVWLGWQATRFDPALPMGFNFLAFGALVIAGLCAKKADQHTKAREEL